MKKTILLILAMCFAFAMPVQATEGCHPVAASIGSGSGDAPVMVLTDSKVTTCRCMQPQLEAADISDEIKPNLFAMIGAGSSNAQWPNGSGAKHEVGWQRKIKKV